MNAPVTVSRESTNELLAAFGKAVANDIALLARLHRSEVTADTAAALRDQRFPLALALKASDREAESVRAMLYEEVVCWPGNFPRNIREELAADFAAIYLNNYCNASPQESYWLDDEHLAWQEPMFAVREVYRRHGIEVKNWRDQADDHLAPQLEFIAWLLASPTEEHLQTVAEFLDEHLLLWLGDFAARVAKRCETPFYAGLALLTHDYIDKLRNVLAQLLDKPRPDPEETLKRLKRENSVPEPVKFMPGIAESW